MVGCWKWPRACEDTLRQVDELKRQVRVADEDVDLNPKTNMVSQIIVGRRLGQSNGNTEYILT